MGRARWVGGLALSVACTAGVYGALGAVATQPSPQAAEEAAKASPETLALGREVFTANCQPCHGSQGKGDGPAARFLDSQPRDLTAGKWLYATDGKVEQIARVVGEGIADTDMEPFDEILTEEEILAVAAYVHDVLAVAAQQASSGS